MISGFVDGYRVTGRPEYLKAAQDAARFILLQMKQDGLLVRVSSKGRAHVKAYSEDYAFLIQALLDLFETTFDMEWLKETETLNREMIRQFWDEAEGGFFFAGKENEALIARSKQPYDNVIPSSNSVAVSNLIRLSHLTGDESLKEKAEKTLRLFYGYLSEHPSNFAQMLSGLSFFFSPEEIGVIGNRNDATTQSMLKEIHLAYLPNKILSFKDHKERGEGSGLPFLKDKGETDGPAVFVCKGFTCLPPVKDVEELKKILSV
jgi:uncharacterized protein YyaL (SSP411 family)